MRLIRLEQRPENWNQLIEAFPQKTIFHESAWLDFVTSSFPHTCVDYFEIRHDDEIVGYFCPVRRKKFVFQVWEGPNCTLQMCPLVLPKVDQLALMQLLVAACKKEGIAHLALRGPWLDPDLMKTSGFVPEHQVSHVCPLSGGKESVWARMHGTCRTRIRKAVKNGLTVEVATDFGFVDEFYSRFAKLLIHKGKVPGYDLHYMRQLFAKLGGADRLFALRVKHQGSIIGTAYYIHDDRGMYLGDVAYEVDSLSLCPTHLLHWTAMQMAIERDIPLFWMGGDPEPSRFTRKFGGDLRPVILYRRNFVPLLHQARQAYQLLKVGRTRALLSILPKV